MGILHLLKTNSKPVVNVKATRSNTEYGHFRPAKYAEGIVVTPWNSKEGKDLLIESEYKNSFFSLAHNYQSQRNPFSGSIASMVTVLNALRLERGIIPSSLETAFKLFDRNTGEIREYSYNIYSQDTFLDAETDNVKPRELIFPKTKDDLGYVDFNAFDPGLNLAQVKRMLELYKCKVRIVPAQDNAGGLAEFITDLKTSLASNNKYIIANFYGEDIGLHQAGHYSTIGAYNERTQAVLVLDTAAHKTPWYWVSVEHLYAAMNTDTREGNKRGYVVVEDSI